MNVLQNLIGISRAGTMDSGAALGKAVVLSPPPGIRFPFFHHFCASPALVPRAAASNWS